MISSWRRERRTAQAISIRHFFYVVEQKEAAYAETCVIYSMNRMKNEEESIINSYSILAQHQTEVNDGKMNRNKRTDERRKKKRNNQGFHAILCELK